MLRPPSDVVELDAHEFVIGNMHPPCAAVIQHLTRYAVHLVMEWRSMHMKFCRTVYCTSTSAIQYLSTYADTW